MLTGAITSSGDDVVDFTTGPLATVFDAFLQTAKSSPALEYCDGVYAKVVAAAGGSTLPPLYEGVEGEKEARREGRETRRGELEREVDKGKR